jgi:type III restriction enzyme
MLEILDLKQLCVLAKYAELKEMWETLNRKVILEYKIDSEEQFYALLKGYFEDNLDSFKKTGSFTRKAYFNH